MDRQRQIQVLGITSVALGVLGLGYWSVALSEYLAGLEGRWTYYDPASPPPFMDLDWRTRISMLSQRPFGLGPLLAIVAGLQILASLVQVPAGIGTVLRRGWGTRLLTWVCGVKWLLYAAATVGLGSRVVWSRPVETETLAGFCLNLLLLVYYSWAFGLLTRPTREPEPSEERMV